MLVNKAINNNKIIGCFLVGALIGISTRLLLNKKKKENKKKELEKVENNSKKVMKEEIIEEVNSLQDLSSLLEQEKKAKKETNEINTPGSLDDTFKSCLDNIGEENMSEEQGGTLRDLNALKEFFKESDKRLDKLEEKTKKRWW